MWNSLDTVPKNVVVLVYGFTENSFEGYVCHDTTIAKAVYDGRTWRIYDSIGYKLTPALIKGWISIPTVEL